MDRVSCSIAASLEVIGDRWTMLILREAFRGTRRFDQFQRDLGLARNLLTDRLNRLVDNEIFHKVPYQDRPVRCEYRLTPKGIDLSPSLVALMHWGDKWVAGEAGPPVVLVHETCGTGVDQEFICWACDCVVTPGQLRSLHPQTPQWEPEKAQRQQQQTQQQQTQQQQTLRQSTNKAVQGVKHVKR